MSYTSLDERFKNCRSQIHDGMDLLNFADVARTLKHISNTSRRRLELIEEGVYRLPLVPHGTKELIWLSPKALYHYLVLSKEYEVLYEQNQYLLTGKARLQKEIGG